mmetsp:Transcript_38655/g.106473  ORF Transcript_38655/g.106473 Transcript_38655/m.106473 type:complete len:304 (-) Transcript_38655:428-1339(-)
MRHHSTNKIRGWHVVLVPGPIELAGRQVKTENADSVGILVRCDQPLRRLVELEMPRRGATRMLDRRHAQHAGERELMMHTEDGDAVVAAVRHKHKVAGRVHSNASTRVEFSWVPLRDRRDRLCQPQRRIDDGPLAFDRTQRRFAVELENGHLGGEFVDHVHHRQGRVELHVPGTEGQAALRSGWDRAQIGQRAFGLVVVECANDVHAEVGHISDAAKDGVQNHRVRMRVHLPFFLRQRVVVRMVHMAVAASDHWASLLWVVHGAAVQHGTGLWVKAKNSDGRVPIIHDEHVLQLFVQREVARR